MLAILCALAGLSLSCNRDAQLSSVSGTIETDEVRVASRYGGRVEALYAQEGDPLKSGQKIVVLNAAELHARRERLAAQLAELEAGPRPQEIAQARAQIAELDSQLKEMMIGAPSDSVLEVLSVKVGDVLAANQQVATLLLPH
ncbi:MAG TPA: biotin/lipoyl-binding protein, partial [Verrucomicrobiae bacterium]|nr:biotin/lipoyl-binding protein [Verrucomicrobiae bacterium]